MFVRKSVFKEILKIYFQTLFKMWNGRRSNFKTSKWILIFFTWSKFLYYLSVVWKTERTSKHLIKIHVLHVSWLKDRTNVKKQNTWSKWINLVCIWMICSSLRPQLPMVTSSKCNSLLWSLHQNATKFKLVLTF